MTLALVALTIGSGLVAGVLTERSRGWSRVFKIVGSTSMILIVFTGDPEFDGYALFITGGLIASWFGDLALSFSGRSAFLVGLASFAFAHAFYTTGFLARSAMDLPSVAMAAIVMAVTAAAIVRWLTPVTPDPLKAPVAMYVAMISVMVVASFGTHGMLVDPRIPTAAVLFMISDVLVARQQFVAPALANRVVGLPIYFAAQTLFAVTVVVSWV